MTDASTCRSCEKQFRPKDKRWGVALVDGHFSLVPFGKYGTDEPYHPDCAAGIANAKNRGK